MAKELSTQIDSQKRWAGGISDYLKESAAGQIPDTYYFGHAVNYRDDPQSITLLPGAIKESGSVITDLLKWGELTPEDLTAYFYGNTGNFYSRTSGGSWTNLHTVPNSHGNGLAYFAGDDYLYYLSDSVIGRYGPIASSPTFTDDFLGAQGGIPLNTASAVFASASSQYAHAADSATLSITSDLTLETFFKASSFPTAGNSMTLLGKWDESGTLKSYKLDLFGVSGYFGNGQDSTLTISADTTEAPIDASCTGTSGTQSLSATNASFTQGQIIFVYQTQGTNAGQWERNSIQSYTAGTITTGTPLLGTYTAGAQVRVLPQYTNVTVNSGKTYSPKIWNGTVGGILAFIASGTLSGTGNLSASGCGFRGGGSKTQGEGITGLGSVSPSANGNGGGGGYGNSNGGGGAGGGNLNAGANGTGAQAGAGGSGVGSADLTNFCLGGGGGGGGADGSNGGAAGGKGGGGIFFTVVTYNFTGTVTANGVNGSTSSGNEGCGGGGSGGSILIKAQVATLGSLLIQSLAGVGSSGTGNPGGAGSAGRIHLDYLTSYTGTTSPSIDVNQDNTLVTTTTIQARLGISDDGVSGEYLTQNLSTIATGVWNRLSVSWVAATATATFYLNAVSLGTFVGTKTAIQNNTSLLYVAANKTSVIANYFNGELNDMRIWANAQIAGQIFANNLTQINPDSPGLAAYYKFNSDFSDSTANTNDLTPVNSPTFSTDVPFPSPTTRLDIDQSYTVTGDTYALKTAISEATDDKLPFTPMIDPQKSVAFDIDSPGTGNWTVYVHDQQNRLIASQTILNANLVAGGFQEFIFSTPWRIVIGKSYHMHLTSTVADGTIVSSVNNDFSTADFYTYFGFLVTDTQYHPAISFQYQPLGGTLASAVIIGNDRYLAVWDGVNYSPNFIAFPAQWRVRCFAFWREFLAIGVWRGGNIYDFDKGRIYFWDGIAPTFNFFIDVPEGQVNAMVGVDVDLYMMAGYRGNLLDYQGGYIQANGATRSNKLKRMPLMAQADYGEVFPGAMNMWRSLLHFGLWGASNSTTMHRATYSYGTYNQFYPDSLSCDYDLSTGNNSTTVTIGCVFPVGQSLIVGWQDGISFGADMINFTNDPASSGDLQVLVRDDGSIWKNKLNFAVRADFLPLQAGESIDCKIKIDRENWLVSSPDATIGEKFTKLPVSTGQGREYQYGVDLYATGTTSPTLIGVALQKNPNKDTQDF